jgi:hypothetical protein
MVTPLAGCRKPTHKDTRKESKDKGEQGDFYFGGFEKRGKSCCERENPILKFT